MGRDFVDTSPGDKIDYGTNPALNFDKDDPFSIGMTVKTAGVSGSGIMVEHRDSSIIEGYSVFENGGSIFFMLRGTSGGNRLFVLTTSTSLDDDVERHVLYTYSGNELVSGITCYLDGVSVALTTITDDLTTATNKNNSLILGLATDGTAGYDGELHDTAIWSRELTAAEAALIGTDKYSPAFVPNGLEFYADLIRETIDRIGGLTGTLVDTTVVPQARTIYPAPIFTPPPPAGDVRNHIIPAYMRLTA